MYLAGGVPEVMLYLRELGVIHGEARTILNRTWNEILDEWEASERRRSLRKFLQRGYGVDPDQVIMPPAKAKAAGLTSTVVFPLGNLCPEGSVIKATSIDPSVVDQNGVFRHRGTVKFFTSEKAAIAAIKGRGNKQLEPGDILVLAGCGPLGTGLKETYQLTSTLKYVSRGKQVTILTDARFSGGVASVLVLVILVRRH